MSSSISDALKYFPLYQSKNTVQEVYEKDGIKKFHIIHCDLIGRYNKVSDLFIVNHFYDDSNNRYHNNIFIVAKQKSWFGFKWVACNITHEQYGGYFLDISDVTFEDYIKRHFDILAKAIPFTKMPTIIPLDKFTKTMKEYAYPALESVDWRQDDNYSIPIPDNLSDNDKADLNAITNIYNRLCGNSIVNSTHLQTINGLPSLPLDIVRFAKIKTIPFPYHYIPCGNGDYIYFLNAFHYPEIITSNYIFSSFDQIKDGAYEYNFGGYWQLFVNEAVKQEYIRYGNQLLRQKLLDRLLSIRRDIINFQRDKTRKEIIECFEKLENSINQRNENIGRLIEDKQDIGVV